MSYCKMEIMTDRISLLFKKGSRSLQRNLTGIGSPKQPFLSKIPNTILRNPQS